jgi:alcohol dehydrogenase
LSLSLPRYFTASTGLDVLSHALESVWNKENNYITRLNAIESIRICEEYLPKLLNQLDSIEYRTEMAKASLLAGMAFHKQKQPPHIPYPILLLYFMIFRTDMLAV